MNELLWFTYDFGFVNNTLFYTEMNTTDVSICMSEFCNLRYGFALLITGM